MTLCEFTNMWFDKTMPIVVCQYKYFDDVYDEIECGKWVGSSWTDFCIVPKYSQWKCSVYLHPKYAQATVRAFKFCGEAMVVFVDIKEDAQ